MSERPAIVAVANPKAANGRARRHALRLHRALEAAGLLVDLRFTQGPLDATRIASEAVAEGFDVLLAIGGDGTLNEVANGFFPAPSEGPPETALAIAPVGTGTDFARTLRQTGNPEEVLDRIRRNRRRTIDVGRVDFLNLEGALSSRYFINIAEFGSGGAVVDKVNRTTKVLGGRMSFLWAILTTMPKYRNTRVRYRADGREGEVVMNNFVVANGCYFGGGLMPAPHAKMDDGKFDVVIIGDITFKEVRRNLGKLRLGEHLGLPKISHFRAEAVETECVEPALLDLDGEMVGRSPTRFELLTKALRIVI